MTPEKWKSRCTIRFMESGRLTGEMAITLAEACFEAQENSFLIDEDCTSPEDCADAIMDFWFKI